MPECSERGQGTRDDLKNKDMKRDLQDRERRHREKELKEGGRSAQLALAGAPSSSSKRARVAEASTNVDADDPVDPVRAHVVSIRYTACVSAGH